MNLFLILFFFETSSSRFWQYWVCCKTKKVLNSICILKGMSINFSFLCSKVILSFNIKPVADLNKFLLNSLIYCNQCFCVLLFIFSQNLAFWLEEIKQIFASIFHYKAQKIIYFNQSHLTVLLSASLAFCNILTY